MTSQLKGVSVRIGRCLCVWLCIFGLGWGLKGSASAASSKKKVEKLKHGLSRLGDVSLRVNAGVKIVALSNVVGEFLTTRVGERGVFGVLLTPEYGYFINDLTVLFGSMPFEVEINPNVGGVWTWSLGVGIRRYLTRYFFADIQALLRIVNRSNFRLEFGGFLVGAGIAVPFLSRYQIFAMAQMPINFWPGFQIGANVLVGIEVLF